MSDRTGNTLQGSLLLSRMQIQALLGATLFAFCASCGLAAPSLPTNEVSTRSLDHSVVISGNQVSNRITIDQSTITSSQVSSVGLNQGTINAAYGSNVTLNVFYGNLPSTATREAVEALDRKLTSATNTIELTRAELRLLARALRDLDERTSGIEKLRDGRTLLGEVVAGTPRVVIEAWNAGLQCYTNRDFAGALEHLTNAVVAMRSSEAKTGTASIGLGGKIEPKGKAMIFSLVADSALKLGKVVLANEFAQMAVQFNPSAQNQALLAVTLQEIGRESLAKGDFASALERSTNAIALWLASTKVPRADGFLLSSNAIANLHGLLADALFSIGMECFAKGDLRSALDRFTNSANASIEFQKYAGPQGAQSSNRLAMVFSYAAETSEKLNNSAQAYEFAKRAFEADGSAFHQAQMANLLLSLDRKDEAKAAAENAFKKDPKDPQIVGLWKRISGAP
jgi:tetratricopeptide (TPR) repeat protein